MFFTVYKITNNLNSKIYIGKHQTKNLDDGYMGSGKHLRHAIKKNGIENFTKEILFTFTTEVEMNTKEAELVTEEFCSRKDTYNICEGGKGGFGYIYSNNLWNTPQRLEAAQKNFQKLLLSRKQYFEIVDSNIHSEKISISLKKRFEKTPHHWIGKFHTEETKRKIGHTNSIKQKGSGNSQFGTHWITNGKENRKVKLVDMIPPGWYKGRIINRKIQ